MSLISPEEFVTSPAAQQTCVLCENEELRSWIVKVMELAKARGTKVPVLSLYEPLREHDPSITRYRVRTHMVDHVKPAGA